MASANEWIDSTAGSTTSTAESNFVDSRMDRVEGRLDRLEDAMREGFDRVNTTLDGIASRLDIDDTERLALSAQVDRHEDWIVDAARATKVNYTPGA